jgi:F-type H+-transporting ATPase subunit delta
MSIARKDLAAILGERTLHVRDVRTLAGAIAAYLLEEKRTSDLESLIRDIMQYRLDHGIVEADLVSAHELPEHVLQDVKAILRQEYPHAKEINLDTDVDPAVVGGVRIELPNEQLDMTVKAKLDTFKRLTVGDAQ